MGFRVRASMVFSKEATRPRRNMRLACRVVAAVAAAILLGYALQRLNVSFNPVYWDASEIISSFLAFTIAANVLVRFRGNGERVSLLLGVGFALSGLIQLGTILEIHQHLSMPGAQLRVPLSSVVGRMLLAVLLLSAVAVERRLPWPREPKKIVWAVLSLVMAIGCLLAFTFLAFPHAPPIHPHSVLPRPWDLLPAGVFLAATVVLYRSGHRDRSAFDAALVWLAGGNAACHFILCESVRWFDGPAGAAQLLKIGSYAGLLGATLIDNVHLFGQVRERATSDSLTGLANYQRFVEALQGELERSGRTRRAFSVLLMDLDGLKQINDRHGHLTGSRAICRVADVLRQHSRAVDTPARYGGDEFALLLPETPAKAASQVAARIRLRLEADTEAPPLSISIGVATHPDHGATVHDLLGAADRELYAAKGQKKGRKSSLRRR